MDHSTHSAMGGDPPAKDKVLETGASTTQVSTTSIAILTVESGVSQIRVLFTEAFITPLYI